MRRILAIIFLTFGTLVSAEGVPIAKDVFLTKTDNQYYVRMLYKDEMSVDIPADYHVLRQDMMSIALTSLFSNMNDDQINKMKLNELSATNSIGFLKSDEAENFLSAISLKEFTTVLEYGQEHTELVFNEVYRRDHEAGVKELLLASGYAKVNFIQHEIVQINDKFRCMKFKYQRSFSVDDEFERPNQIAENYRCLNFDKSFGFNISYNEDLAALFAPIVKRVVQSIELN